MIQEMHMVEAQISSMCSALDGVSPDEFMQTAAESAHERYIRQHTESLKEYLAEN